MGDYYQILGIEQSAGADEIKRAYFQKVRKYPPERYPDEFKELRAAYETLSDEMGREKYDKGLALKSSLPGEAVGLLEEAALARKSGLAEKAEELIKTAADKFADFPELKKELGMFYLSESKSGKAAAVFEKLCRKFPDSADYASALAQAYMERGWRKKAIAEYKRAIRLDPVFLGPRIGLFDCYYMSREWDNLEEACADAERAAEEMGGEAFLLYTAMSAVMIGNEPELAEWYLKEAVRILRDVPGVPREAAELMIGETLNKIMVIGSVRMFPYFRQMTETLKNVNAGLADMMKNAERIYVIETLSDRGYSLLFHDLFANLMNDCDCDNCRCELASMEFHILSNLHEFRQQLTRLKEEYPELYGMHEKFFGEALTTRFPKKLMDKREKFLAKRGFSPAANFDGDTLDDFMEDLEDFITMRRETPKIGRNDPCPCGSGKKYKRCCGA